MLKELRRIVTGHNTAGKSVVAIDGPPGAMTGDTGLGEIWITDSTPADNAVKGDPTARRIRLEPPPNGSVLRYFTVAPEDPTVSRKELEAATAAAFAQIGAAHCRPDTTRHPRMHTTRTVDYIVVLSGEVTLLLDEAEVNLKPFDTVVQRGTNHAWINRGKQPALLAAVLIDAKPL